MYTFNDVYRDLCSHFSHRSMTAVDLNLHPRNNSYSTSFRSTTGTFEPSLLLLHLYACNVTVFYDFEIYSFN